MSSYVRAHFIGNPHIQADVKNMLGETNQYTISESPTELVVLMTDYEANISGILKQGWDIRRLSETDVYLFIGKIDLNRKLNNTADYFSIRS